MEEPVGNVGKGTDVSQPCHLQLSQPYWPIYIYIYVIGWEAHHPACQNVCIYIYINTGISIYVYMVTTRHGFETLLVRGPGCAIRLRSALAVAARML